MSMFWASCQNHGGGVVVPITSPLHPDVIAMYNMDLVAGSVLSDNSVNGNNGSIVGAVSGSDVNGDYLDFDAITSNRVDMPPGVLDGLTKWSFAAVVLAETGNNGCVWSYGWGYYLQGNTIVLNEPANQRSRALMRDIEGSTSTSPVQVIGTQAPLALDVVIITYDGTDFYFEMGGSSGTVLNAGIVMQDSYSKLGNREGSTSPFNGKIYKAAWYDTDLSPSQRQDWRDLI